MAEPVSDHWHPRAAYLYLLHLDNVAFAWEYLRRHPDYRRDWLRRRRHPDAARRWGLRLLVNPDLDARDAHPIWFPDPDVVVQLHPDIDPPPDAAPFEFWRIPGDKQLVHDGRRLVLAASRPGYCMRLVLAPALQEGMAYVFAFRTCSLPCARHCALTGGLTMRVAGVAPAAMTKPRPAPATLLEMRTLQALDGILAGASVREIAAVLRSSAVTDESWHADSGLRSKVRRLVRRGRSLMEGGYRGLLRT